MLWEVNGNINSRKQRKSIKILGLTRWLSWLGIVPQKEGLLGSISGHGWWLGCGFCPQLGHV